MKSTVEQLSPTRVKINVEVPFDELKPDFDRAYKKIAQQVNIPGFRPGKAPARVLEQRLGRGVVLEEVVSGAVPAKYAEIVSAEDVHPLGRPEIEVTKIEDGDHVAFTAEVDVRPKIEMPVFGELEVSVDDVEVTEALVDEQLDGLRSRFGTLTQVERPAREKDFVVLDLSATIDGEKIAELATTDLSYQIGSGDLAEGVDSALLGATQGEQRTFTTTVNAGEHTGQQAEVTATVQAVKERELPVADDEFAQEASEFDTIEELRADLRSRLGRVMAMQQGAQARDEVLKALLAAADVPLPERIVEGEYESRKRDALRIFDNDEQSLGRWLEKQGRSAEEFDNDLRTTARDTVKAHLVLDEIADAEGLTVSDNELHERLVYQAQRRGMSPNDYAMQVQESGELASLYADVRRGKALITVVRQAKVTDASGNPVDVDALMDEAAQH
ncbi:MAG TPA: trigger factor [Pseudonocardiaceae bacterium]|nr:trigger factor [Pseudonocardiaceae bacterium]